MRETYWFSVVHLRSHVIGHLTTGSQLWQLQHLPFATFLFSFPQAKSMGEPTGGHKSLVFLLLFHSPMLCPWLRRPCPQHPLANYSTCPLNLSTCLDYITGARGTHLPAHPCSVSSAHGTCPPTLSSSEVPADGTCLPARNSIQPTRLHLFPHCNHIKSSLNDPCSSGVMTTGDSTSKKMV